MPTGRSEQERDELINKVMHGIVVMLLCLWLLGTVVAFTIYSVAPRCQNTEQHRCMTQSDAIIVDYRHETSEVWSNTASRSGDMYFITVDTSTGRSVVETLDTDAAVFHKGDKAILYQWRGMIVGLASADVFVYTTQWSYGNYWAMFVAVLLLTIAAVHWRGHAGGQRFRLPLRAKMALLVGFFLFLTVVLLGGWYTFAMVVGAFR